MRHLAQHHGGIRHLWWLVTLLILLLASYVVAGRQLMKALPEWRHPLQTMLQERIGMPLTIGSLQGRMDGLTPVFKLHHVVIPALDGQSDHNLVIDTLSLAPDLLASLVHGSLRLDNLNVSGLQLHLQQDTKGHIRLRGFPVMQKTASQGDGLQRFLALLYRQQDVTLSHMAVTLKLQDKPLLRLPQMRLEMHSSGNNHHLALRVRAPKKSLTVNARLELDRDAYDLSDLDGKAYVSLKGPDLEHLLRYALGDALPVTQLDGELALWMEVRGGQLQHTRLTMQLNHLRLQGKNKHWDATGISGQLAIREHNGYQIQIKGLDFDTSEGHWHSGVIGGWWNGKEKADASWKLLLTELNLRQLGGQLLHWPFALPDGLQKVRQQLDQLRPRAQVLALYAEGQGKQITQLSGRFFQAGFNADGKIPGVTGLSGWFDGSLDSGVAVIHASRLGLDLPVAYDHALYASVEGALSWSRNAQGVEIKTGLWHVSNSDGDARLVAGMTLSPEQVPQLHLLAYVVGDRIERAGMYLPGQHMPPPLYAWLKSGIRGGRLLSGRFLYEGPVKIDPHRQQDRIFQMQFDIADAELKYRPGWPVVTNLSGHLLIDGRLVYGSNLQGRLNGSKIKQASFRVWNDEPGQVPLLQVNADVDARAKDVAQILQATPLAKKLPNALANWQLDAGRVTGQLTLKLDLKKAVHQPPQIIVDAQLHKVRLANAQRRLTFRHMSGHVHFDMQKGIKADQITGQWLGGELSGHIKTSANKVVIAGQLTPSSTQLVKWLGTDLLTADQGKTPLTASVTLPWHSKKDVMLQVGSQLANLGVALPPPLDKSPADKSDFSFELASNGQLRIQWQQRPSHRASMNARLWLRDGRVDHGQVYFGGVAIPPTQGEAQQGVYVSGQVGALSAAPWISYVQQMNNGSDAAPVTLSRLVLQVDKLNVYGAPIKEARVNIKPYRGKGWLVSLDSKSLAGTLIVPQGYQLRGDKPLVVKVKHLNWQGTDSQGVSGLPSPTQFPVANVSLNNLVINGARYGSWQGQIRPLTQGVKVQHLKGHWRHATFDGTLTWQQQQKRQISHYKGKVSSNDLEAVLKAWEMKPMIISDDVTADVNLAWVGSPLDINYLGLMGHVSVSIGQCRLPYMDKNNILMRLLGMLNTGSLARRLQLDFSDVYKKGLSCDSIKSHLVFDHHLLQVKKLHLKSPSADITLTGRTNLKTKTLDNKMSVVLPLSSNLYAGCLAGPAACAGIFVFERLFGDKLEKAAALEYHIGGTWDNPKIEEK